MSTSTFLTPQEARKEMFALVAACWANKAGAIVSPVPEVRYQGVEEAALPGSSHYWMRVGTTTVTTRQSGFRSPDAPDGSQVVYDNYGFITLQMFAPMKGKDTWNKGELLSQLGQGMFMASETGGGVWFRNPRIRELNNDGTWFRWNVIADYQFSQVKGNQAGVGRYLNVAGDGDGLAFVGDNLLVDVDSLPLTGSTSDGLELDGSNLKVDIQSLPSG